MNNVPWGDEVNEHELMADILASPAVDEQISIGLGRFLIQSALINLWLGSEGSDSASSDEFIAYVELRESKWLQIKEAWSVVQEREVQYGHELAASANESEPQDHRERYSVRMRLDESTGYRPARVQLSNLLNELIGLSDTLTARTSWLPECVLCESKLR